VTRLHSPLVTVPPNADVRKPTRVAHSKRMALFGKFGAENIGNECTLAALLENIHRYRPQDEVLGVCTDPEDTRLRHKIRAVPIEAVVHRRGADRNILRFVLVRLPAEIVGWVKAVRALYGTDALMMTGTGMLTDSGESLLGFPYEIFKWVCAARCCGCRVRFIAVGVGPMRSGITRTFIHTALRLADYRSYRDNASRRRLQDQGFNAERDSVVPDLAFSLREPPALETSNGGARRVIGVGVMDNYGPPDTERRRRAFFDTYIAKTAAFIVWLVRHDYVVRILHGDVTCDEEPRWRLRSELARQGVGSDDGRVIDSDIRSVDDLWQQLTMTDIIISPRYHNLVLGMMLNKPVIALSYDYKNEALLTEAGLGEYWQRVEELDVERLIAQFEQAERNSDAIRLLLENVAQRYREQWKNEYSRIFADL